MRLAGVSMSSAAGSLRGANRLVRAMRRVDVTMSSESDSLRGTVACASPTGALQGVRKVRGTGAALA